MWLLASGISLPSLIACRRAVNAAGRRQLGRPIGRRFRLCLRPDDDAVGGRVAVLVGAQFDNLERHLHLRAGWAAAPLSTLAMMILVTSPRMTLTSVSTAALSGLWPRATR